MWWIEPALTVYRETLAYLGTLTGHVLSWPVVALAIVGLLLNPIRSLLERIRMAKGFGGEVQLDAVANSLMAAVEQATSPAVASKHRPTPTPNTSTGATTGAPSDRWSLLTQQAKDEAMREGATVGLSATNLRYARFHALLTKKDPKATVLSAWSAIRGKLVALDGHVNGGVPRAKPTSRIIADLAESPIVPEGFVDALAGLDDLRRQVASGDITPDQEFARRFIGMSLAMDELADMILARASDPGSDNDSHDSPDSNRHQS
jgi:hypothetical protein